MNSAQPDADAGPGAHPDAGPGAHSGARPYDAILLLSFGGPERPDEVLPFLENVTHGRGIPADRLLVVAEHYHHFGGRSPINDANRALLAALRTDLDARGLADLPLYWGNRNWHPFLTPTLRQAQADGVRRLAVVVTSAYASYSGCRQYREDLADALADLGPAGPEMVVDKMRHPFDHPGFVAPAVDAVVDGVLGLDPSLRRGARLVFVTHSLPTVMSDTSGGGAGGAYLAQHRDVARNVVAAAAERLGHAPEWDLVFCSRSGPARQSWLEPDVNDHLRALRADGVPAVVAVPIGFVADHMEVVYDLDTEARRTAATLDLPFVRAATVGADPRFAAALVDLVLERAAVERGEAPVRAVTGALGPAPDRCPGDCCPNPRGPRPAACGADTPAVAR